MLSRNDSHRELMPASRSASRPPPCCSPCRCRRLLLALEGACWARRRRSAST
jgi:hypothetical protein